MAGDVLGQGVHRPVGRGEGDVQEERLGGVILDVLADEARRRGRAIASV